MDINDINLFIDVCNTGNITKAANNRFMTQSAMSKKLRLLEEELGVQLFERGKGMQKAKLTRAGERFVDIAFRMSDLYKQAMHIKDDNDRQYFTIGCINSVQAYSLPPVITTFQQKHPLLSVTLEDHHTAEIIPLVLNHRLDIGIVHTPSPYPELESELLFEEQYRLVMRQDQTIFSEDQVVSPDLLPPGHEIFETFGPNFAFWHDQIWSQTTAKVRVNNTSTAERYFSDPQDWIIVPENIAQTMTIHGFSSFRLVPQPPPYKVYAIYPKKNAHPLTTEFLANIKSYI